jgi:hypothetical protein
MEYLLIAGGVGVFTGFSLGVLVMALIGASDPDKLPTPPACGYPHRECLVAQKFAKAA